MLDAERPTNSFIEQQKSKKQVKEISLTDGTILRGFQITQTFWQMAKADGAFERFINTDIKSTSRSGYMRRMRERDLQVCTSFIEDPDITYDNCGEGLGINSSSISRNIIENTPALVWKFTSEDIQRQFPLENLSQQKPMSIKTMKEISQIPWARTRNINTDILSGLIETSENRQEVFDILTDNALKRLIKAGVIVSLRSVLLTGAIRKTKGLKSIAEFLKEGREDKEKVAVGELMTTYRAKSERRKLIVNTRFFLAAADAEKARSKLAQYPNLHSL